MARHWIFDLDGTLINSFPLYISVFEEVSQHFQVEMTAAAWHDLPHIVLPKFLEKYFPAHVVKPAFDMVIERNMARQEEIQVYTGLSEILDHIKDAGCDMSICTARELKTAKGILEEKGLNRYFTQMVSRDCVAVTKPHPEGIQRLMFNSRATPEQTLMVGDHKMDIDAAKAAGILSISVCWNQHVTEDLSVHSDHHFEEVAEFQRWVKQRVPKGF